MKKEKVINKNYNISIIASIFIVINLIINLISKLNIGTTYNILISIILLIVILYYNLKHKLFSIIISIFIILASIVFGYNLFKNMQPKLINFTGMDLTSSLNWCSKNKITCNQVYEYNDTVPKYHIFLQSEKPGVNLNKINFITLSISDGPDLNKEMTLKNLIGLGIDEVVKYIDENNLSNVIVNYLFDDVIKQDIIISQSTKGLIKRNTEIILNVSLGEERVLPSVKMIDLKNTKIFNALLFLKRNGIKYELSYDFSEEIETNHVISSSKNQDDLVDPNLDTIKLIISKGKKITVPDFSTMTQDEIIKWTVDNKLKLIFEEIYSSTVEQGKFIQSNFKTGDAIETGSTIKITLSKGKLLFKTFNSLNELRVWASNNNILINEEYEFNNTISSGSIIKYSHNVGDVLNNNDTITVYISSGSSVVVPNFYGKTKAVITDSCNKLKLKCTFSTVTSSKPAGTAVSQSKRAGSSVSVNSYVNIGLSNGKTTTIVVPTCDRTLGSKFYIPSLGDTGNETYQIVKNQNPKFTINASYVTQCPNGDNQSGNICNINTYNGKWLTYCDPVNLTIVK